MISSIAGLQVSRIHVPSKAAYEAGGGTGGTVENTFREFMQEQLESNWCWSACATSVGLFFGTGKWTQCDTATGVIEGTDCYQGQPLNCCDTPDACNCYGYLDDSLTYTKSFNTMMSGTYSSDDIEAQINLGNPVCVRVAWFLGGAHFLAITGFSYPSADPNTFTIYLQDSIYGSSSLLLSEFANDYQSGGTWTHTYLTQPN
jgi:hypothetical protein